MYIAIKSGYYLHENIGIYDRSDVAIAFAAQQLQQERDDYHVYKIYYRAPEAPMTFSYPVYVLSNVGGKIMVDHYNPDGELLKAFLYEEKSL